jgi:DNA repair protein RecO (recombination protein O)
MSIHRTPAIVLRTRKVRESSKIAVFFTRNYGKISALAKGCLKPKSKFGSSLELFTRSSIIFYRKENRELHTLSHSEIVNAFGGVKQDVVKLAYASVAGELVERLVPGEEPNKTLFSLLEAVLKEVDVATRSQLEVVLSSYELKMLHLVGYGPELARCVRCGKPAAEKSSFGLISGGVLCQACSGRDLNAVEMSPEALELLRAFEADSIGELRQRYSAGEVTREASDILNSFVRAQIGEGAKIKSLDFLERMRDASYAE